MLADELYESHMLAITKDSLLFTTLSPNAVILRGRIEDITGWALFQKINPGRSRCALKRAVSVTRKKVHSGMEVCGDLALGRMENQKNIGAYKLYKSSTLDAGKPHRYQIALSKKFTAIRTVRAKSAQDPFRQIQFKSPKSRKWAVAQINRKEKFTDWSFILWPESKTQAATELQQPIKKRHKPF